MESLYRDTAQLPVNRYADKLFGRDYTQGTVETALLLHQTRYGEPLAPASQRTLIAYARHHNPNLDLAAPPQTRTQATMAPRLRELLGQMIREYRNRLPNLTRDLDLDLAICCVVILATNLRASELKQLTYAMLEQIHAGRLVPLRLKQRLKAQRIIANTQILTMHMGDIRRLRGTGPLIKHSTAAIVRKIRKYVMRYGYVPGPREQIGLLALRKSSTHLFSWNNSTPIPLPHSIDIAN